MKQQRDRENWLWDVSAKQQNTVFPDTLQNEVSGWRKLMASKRPLSWVQVVGIALLCVGMGAFFWGDSKWRPLGDWAILFVAFGVFFLVLRWRVRRALSSRKS